MASFFDTITEAVKFFSEHGYASQAELDVWMARIAEAARATMTPPHIMEQMLRDALGAVYRRMVEQGGALKQHPGVAKFTLEKIAPRLRGELDKRIMSSAQLIRLNREQAIAKTLQRFSGWATSIPAGGSDNVDKVDEKTRIRKALASLPFSERRVLIDQGHKLNASISEILAIDSGAIGGVWRSHWRQAGYDYRPDHKDRDGKFYMLRGNWAQQRSLVKTGTAGYYDEITAVAQEPFCRCFMTWTHNLRSVPDACMTEKGRTELAKVRVSA